MALRGRSCIHTAHANRAQSRLRVGSFRDRRPELVRGAHRRARKDRGSAVRGHESGRWGFVSVAYDFLSNCATNFCQSSSSLEGDSSKAAANLYQPGVLLDSARTMYPVPDTLTLRPSSPAPTKVTSTSIDWPGSIRCGEGKHSPVLLRFCVTKGAGSGFTMPPTPFTRRGNKAVNRGWRLRSGVDVISRHPLANKQL
jgi:hypothetical protein